MSESLFRLMLLLSVVLCLVVSPVSAAHLEKDADTILYNGKIITVDNNFSIVDAVAIKDGRFVAVGKTGEALRFAGKNTQKINLKGKVVIPGLIDSHNHMFSTGTGLNQIQLINCTTLEEVLKAIGDKAKSVKPDEWVQTSGGWHESQLAEKRLPNRWELDSVAPNNPVFLPRGGHVAVVNSLALQLAGVTKDTPNPPGGEIKKDPATGEPTGLVLDSAKNFFTKLMPILTYQNKLQSLKAVVQEFNRYGITGIIEPGLSIGSDEIRAYMELWAKGELTVRSGVMVRMTADQIKSAPYYQGFGDEILRISGIKMIIDGGVETAWLKDPYLIVPGEQENPNYYGLQVTATQVFKDACSAAAKNGWHVETHAVGDQAIETVVNTYEEVNGETPIKDLRWTVMHIFLPTQESINKMKQIGIWATVQDHPTYLGSNQLRYWGQSRAAFAIPIRKLIDEGIPLGGGTDSSVVSYNPFLSLWWMVTRKTVTAGTLGPEQKITREEALRLYTIGSAHFTFEEEIKGSIEPGKLADLVILDKDILTIPEDEIKDIKPVSTMLGGEFVYQTQ
jgi:predicted amidohydrolase YtcJ